MMTKRSTFKIEFILVLLMIAVCPMTTLKAQTFAEVDYVVTNKLYDFLIEYEEAINTPDFSKNNLSRFYYNNQVEVYNDLTSGLPLYIPNFLYLQVLDSLKGEKPGLGFFHYDLKLRKKQIGLYFDIVHFQLMREIVDNSVFKVDTLPIDSANVIGCNTFDFTVVFNKFEGDGVFKILKIENADESLMPDAWHKNLIPDEIRVSMGPSFVNFNSSANDQVTTKNSNGFDAGVTIENRFAGGKNVAVSWFLGVGATYINSNWALNYDSTEVGNQEDYYYDSYTRRIVSNNIEQDMNMLYLKVPLGVSVRLFNPYGFSLSFRGEIAPHYLLSSNYKVNNGEITYSGTYTETIGGVDYPFHLTNLGDLYDFHTGTATKNTRGINLEKFGATVGFSVQASYKVGRHFDVFIAPTWRWGITDLLDNSTGTNLISLDNWEANPIIEMENNPNFNVTSIEAGVIFRLNNIVKPFIKKTNFKNTERKKQKDNFEQYLVDQIQISYEIPEYEKKQRKIIDIQESDITKNKYPGKIKYSNFPKSGIEKNYLKAGKKNRLKTKYQALFLFKPFMYDLYSTNYKEKYNANHKVLFDSLNNDNTYLEMSYLPDLNVNIVMDMNSGVKGIRDKIIDNYRKSVNKLGDEECALYFYEIHGSIKKIFEESEKTKFCFLCNKPDNSINEIVNKPDGRSEPDLSFINELRILLNREFNLERRNINLNFFIGSSVAFITIFDEIQNLARANNLEPKAWSGQNESENIKRELNLLRDEITRNPVEVNQFEKIVFFIDFNNKLITKIRDKYYDSMNKKKDLFKQNTYKTLYQYIKSDGLGKKSIRLRNFKFNKM